MGIVETVLCNRECLYFGNPPNTAYTGRGYVGVRELYSPEFKLPRKLFLVRSSAQLTQTVGRMTEGVKVLQIFAIDLKTNERFEITDLYWFEEEGVHDFGGEAHYAKYAFEVFVHGVMVYPQKGNRNEISM